MTKVFACAFLIFCAQQFQHTNLSFSLLYFAFLMLSAIGFNFAEGFTRLTGAYIFWYSTLIVIVGVTWKTVLGEPAGSNLASPLLDMALYTTSMAMLVLVTLLNKKMDFRSLGVGGGLSGTNLNYTAAGLGCLLVGYGIVFADSIFGQAPGGIISALNQVNVFPELGLILSTIGAIKDSGGRRSTNAVNIIGLSYYTAMGMASFSKQAMFTPMVCWLVGAFYSRLKLRSIHIVAFITMGLVGFYFFAPLSAARDLVPVEGADTLQRFEIIGYQITHWSQFEAHVRDLQFEQIGGVGDYYDTPQSTLINRLSMLPPDDSLLSYSAEGHYEGLDPIIEDFENLAPHFISPNKHKKFSGNYYAHEIGRGLSADDFTTGISFSPVAEAYHCVGWGGILWLLPLIWIMLFTSVDFVVGDMSKYPWGLMVVVWFAHAAPETLVEGIIYFIGYGNFGMLFAILVVTRIAPIIGTLFMGRSASPAVRPMSRIRPVRPQHQI